MHGCARVDAAKDRVTLRDRPQDRTPAPGFESLAREFPSIAVELATPTDESVTLELAAWRDPQFDLWAFDRAIERASMRGFAITLIGPPMALPRMAIEVLTRCQRLLRRRNHASATPLFDAVLDRHRSLHDLSLPLVQADHAHALDVWQWLLRLDPRAGLPVQLAALFHDIERLVSESERRIEQHAADYQAFKDRHGARGAELTTALLRELELPDSIIEHTARLIAAHERRAPTGDAALLGDADALSFFSLNSAGFADCYGPAHTRMKVGYSLDRLRPAARRRLADLHVRPDIRHMIETATAARFSLERAPR